MSKGTIGCILITFAVIIMCGVFMNIGVALELGAMIVISIGLLLIIALFFAQFLAFTFVFKLKHIQSDADLDKNKDKALIKTVRKYSKLSVISVMFTTLYALVMIILGSLPMIWTRWSYESLAIILCLDVFIDSLCMILSLQANDKYYQILCCVNCLKDEEESMELPRVKSPTYKTVLSVSTNTKDSQKQPDLVDTASVSEVASDEDNEHNSGYKLYDTPAHNPCSPASPSLNAMNRQITAPPTPEPLGQTNVVLEKETMPTIELK